MPRRLLYCDLGELNCYALHGPLGHGQWHSHGAGVLVTAARQAGVDIDFYGLKWCHSWAEYRLKLREGQYDFLALGMMSWDYPSAVKALQIARSVNPNITTVVGGIHCTVAPEQVLELDTVDHVVYGEGERVFPALCHDPDAFPREVQGLPLSSLDDAPWMDRSIFPRPLDNDVGWIPGPSASFISTRSCAFNCGFCQPQEHMHFGRMQRRRSVSNLIGEIKDVVARYNPKSVIFHDPLFIQQPKWILEFCDAYAEIGLPFWASARADIATRRPDLIRRLKEVGMDMLSLGLEAGSQRMLDWLGKGTTVAQNYAAIELANELDLKVLANIILAIPGETREEAFQSMRMLYAIKRPTFSPAFFAPYPGTHLGAKLEAEGLSLLDRNTYHRSPTGAKVRGVDYQFAHDLMQGKYDREVRATPIPV